MKKKIFIFLIFVAITASFLLLKNTFNAGPNTTKTENSNTPTLADRLNYLDYSASNLESAKKVGKPVLFFAATTWCQTCSRLDKEIREKSNLLPSDVTILKVDYDQDSEMKRKWGISTQHTLIELDSGGKEIHRWIGGYFDTLVQNIK